MSIILLYLITNFYGIFGCFNESAIGVPLKLLAPLNGDISLCRMHGANSAGRLPGSAPYCWRPYAVT